MKKNISVSLLLIVSSLLFSQENKNIPEWFLSDLAKRVGIWRANNAKYQSESEPFDEYEIVWKWGVGQKIIYGELFGIKEGKRADKFWDLHEYWDLEINKGVIIQIGPDGTLAKGLSTAKIATDSFEVMQVIYTPYGQKINFGHRGVHMPGKQITKSYSISNDGLWEEKRAYEWQRKITSGDLKSIQVTSEALKLNRINEGNTRDVMVYTPPDYERNVKKRYPTVYLLHSYGNDAYSWIKSPHTQGFNIQKSVDSLILKGVIEDMIVIMPDCNNKFGGSWYTNSSTSGYWIDFITSELVPFIDSNYRTKANPQYRGIAGHSMGGYGALKIAMKNPNVFGIVYAMSSVNLASDKISKLKYPELLEKLEQQSPLKNYTLWDKLILSKALAFVPNDVSPYYSDYLYTKKNDTLALNQIVWKKWIDHLLVNQIDEYKNSGRKLNIALDHGYQDFLVDESRAFSRKLHEKGIKHIYSEYEGDHTNNIRRRIQNHMFPFFSNNFK